jgi:hypothetical protein
MNVLLIPVDSIMNGISLPEALASSAEMKTLRLEANKIAISYVQQCTLRYVVAEL